MRQDTGSAESFQCCPCSDLQHTTYHPTLIPRLPCGFALHSQPPRMFQAQCTCAPGPGTGRSLAAAPKPSSLCSLHKNQHSSIPCTSAHAANSSQGWGPLFLPRPDFSAMKQHEVSWETQAHGIFLPPCWFIHVQLKSQTGLVQLSAPVLWASHHFIKQCLS